MPFRQQQLPLRIQHARVTLDTAQRLRIAEMVTLEVTQQMKMMEQSQETLQRASFDSIRDSLRAEFYSGFAGVPLPVHPHSLTPTVHLPHHTPPHYSEIFPPPDFPPIPILPPHGGREGRGHRDRRVPSAGETVHARRSSRAGRTLGARGVRGHLARGFYRGGRGGTSSRRDRGGDSNILEK